jgi:hypothetical protein
MGRPGRGGLALALMVAALAVAAPTAAAHVTRVVDGYTITLGWGNEPPFAGFQNFVEVGVTDASGAPVTDLGTSAEVEVSFGDAQTVVPLVASEEPGEFHAALVPTRPGTYAFDLTATIKGRDISTSATCSDRTFECVTAASEVEFPVKDPSVGEVAQRVASTLPQAQEAADTADTARTLAIVALVLAAAALAGSLVIIRRGRGRAE